MKQQLGPLQTQFLIALRSGKYKQISGTLYDGDGHCALGVACRVAGLSASCDESKNYWDFGLISNLDGLIPDKAMEVLKFTNDIGGPDNRAIYRLNDRLKKTFSEIADIIEANPEVYFSEAA